jgi:hypothetical protein
MRTRAWVSALALCATLCVGSARAAVTEDNFNLRNTGDLIALCSPAQSDPLYTAASNFCHGFAVGVFRVLQEEDAARRSNHLFCLPNPPPTRSEAVASFTQWVNAKADRMALPAADGIAAFLADQYKCPRGR